jgi:hypothetical protein
MAIRFVGWRIRAMTSEMDTANTKKHGGHGAVYAVLRCGRRDPSMAAGQQRIRMKSPLKPVDAFTCQPILWLAGTCEQNVSLF